MPWLVFTMGLGVVLSVLAGCDELGHGCTEIGCMDQVALTLRPSDGPWADGRYALTLALDDGSPETCAFELPADLPELGSVREIRCSGAATFFLQQEATCTETSSDGARHQTCTPVQGRYTLQSSVPGTPRTVSVELTRDGAALIEESLEPSYRAERPNGPDCEPTCRQASLELSWD